MDSVRLNVLLIEDNPGDARLIQLMLDEAAAEIEVALARADRLSAGLEWLHGSPIDVVLLDLSLPDSQGFDTFTRLHDHAPSVPIVVLSGLQDEEMAVRAVHAGAQDYLVKGQVNGHVLVRALRYAVERQRLEQQRVEMDRQQREFFTSISHDLRTPLAAIKASVSVLLADPSADLSSTAQRLLQNIDTASDEMSALVEDILALARLQAGREELWLTEQDLRELVTRAARAIEPLAATRHQRLELDLPAEPVRARVDAERLGRVLLNLLGNAQ
jgi:signal transduction histidine kinase